MSDIRKNKLDADETVVIKKDDIEERLRRGSEDSTVLESTSGAFKSIFDPELEAILRETEGYEAEPEPESEREPERETEPTVRSVSSSAQRVIDRRAEEKEHRRKKKLLIVCVAAVAALAALLVLILALKSGGEAKEYRDAYEKAQTYYYDGEYDKALEKLREAMAIDKTDECLLLMSQCYEAKYDYVNAIAILESSNSDSESIKKRIELLKKAKEEYDSGKVVLICGEQYDVETTVLDLSGKGARSGRLADVGKLTELTSLKLSDNKITTLDFLEPLGKLVSLDLSNNEIIDISALAGLKNLRTLHLDGNEVKDFTPLYGLNKLTMLTICDIEIKESQLKQLKEKLPGCVIYSDEAKEDVIDITLGGKTFKSNVTELDLSGSGVKDISQLSVCTKLTKLDLSGNSISDISALVDIPGLTELDLSDNSIGDISPLVSMTKLTKLDLSNNSIKSVAALKELTKLTELQIGGNKLGSFSVIGKLTALKTLGLNDTGLEDPDLSGLYALKNLKKLNIEDNSALTESGVSALQKKLPGCTISHSELVRSIELGGKSFPSDSETVEATDLGLTDISRVSGFTNLKHLDLSKNQISSVSALSALTSLETLDLSDNKITDVSPLHSLTGLKQLWLGGNNLSADQIAALRAALPDCYISVE
ncbi:MAG: leucine-rich repeat domain-containing protein [Oscillospiraceae bacterium]|nr:leucine-rich repeat domain-containing protein [Oscillospiraceae bacterium]